MNDATNALAEWKNGAVTRGQLLRRLLEYENWMMPMRENSGVDPFGPFALALAHLVPDSSGGARLFLFADGDVMETFAETHNATGGIGFANPTGWEIFSVALDGVSAVVLDPGSAHEFVIPAAEFPEVAELAEAVAVEQAWQRLRKGEEEEGDARRVARYPGYHLALVQRAEGTALIHVPHDDGRMFVPVFTHADALALALEEFRENFASAEVKTIKVGGEQAFPVLAKEETAEGIVFNFRGPGEPMAFHLDMTELMLAELAKPAPAAPPVS